MPFQDLCASLPPAQPFLMAAAAIPRQERELDPLAPHCQLWVLQLSLLGTREDPWIQPPAPPSLPSALQPLEEFSTVGAGGFCSTASQQLRKSHGGPSVPCPALSPCLGIAGSRIGAHTAAAGLGLTQPQQDGQCHVPAAARGIFPELWDECDGALEPVLGLGAAPVSGPSRKQPQVTLVLGLISIPVFILLNSHKFVSSHREAFKSM